MPPRLLLFLLPRGGLLPPLRRPSPALSPLLRRTPSNKPPGYFFLSPVRAFSGYSGMAAAGSPEQQPRSVVVKETVELTEKEEQIFRRLLDVVRHFGLGTQLRVAGGWVRDKVNLFVPAFPHFNYNKGKLSLGPSEVEYQKEPWKF